MAANHVAGEVETVSLHRVRARLAPRPHPGGAAAGEAVASRSAVWMVLSSVDTEECPDDSENLEIADFNTVCALEPAMILVWDMPVGSDIEIIKEPNGHTRIYDHATDEFVVEPGPDDPLPTKEGGGHRVLRAIRRFTRPSRL